MTSFCFCSFVPFLGFIFHSYRIRKASNLSHLLINVIYASKAGYLPSTACVMNCNKHASICKLKVAYDIDLWQPPAAHGRSSWSSEWSMPWTCRTLA